MTRWKLSGAFCLLTLLTTIVIVTSHAAVPGRINYQAQLTDRYGVPRDGDFTISFSLYDDLSAGTMVWREVQDVTVAAGILDVVLGAINPFSGDEFAGSRPLFLQIDIQPLGTTDWESLTPRQQLTAVPFALQADNAERLDGLEASAFADVDHAHDFADLTGAATDAQIPDTITVLRAGHADHADAAADADTVDGLHATAFASRTHNHDADYVNEGQADSVTAPMIVDGAVGTAGIRNNAVTADKVSPDIVSSLDGVANDGGNIDLVAGANVTITPDDGANAITISASGGGATDHGALTGLSDDDHPQYLLDSGDTMTGDLTVGGHIYGNGDLYAGTNLTTDNDFLFMDDGSQYFSWLNTQDTFWTTNDLALNGVLQTGGIQANPGYNRFGGGTAISANVTDSSDVLVSDDLDVLDDVHIGGALTVGSTLKSYGDLYVGTNNGNDNDFIFMDGVNEALFWSESEDRFQFSDDLFVAGGLETGGNVTAGGDVQSSGEFKYAAAKTFVLSIPPCGFVSSHPDMDDIAYFPIYVTAEHVVDFYTPLQLPQGASLKNVQFFYRDNSADMDIDMSGRILKFDWAGAAPSELLVDIVCTTSGESDSIDSFDVNNIDLPPIDNTLYKYIVWLNFEPIGTGDHYFLGFFGCRVTYTLEIVNP